MKKGISIWAFTGHDLAQKFALAREAGFDGVELSLDETGALSLDSSESDIVSVREMAAKSGIELYSLATGLYWKYPLTAAGPAARAKAENIVRKQLETAALLGCDTILVLPGLVSGLEPGGDVVPYDTVYNRALEALTRLAPYAAEQKVAIGLENVWNKFLLSPLETRDFIDKINSPFVKAYFDVGNVVRDGYPEQWIRILGSRIAKVHFKDYKRAVGTLDGFCDLLSGDVDYPEVMKALGEAGYDGWVTAEVFPYLHHPEALIFGASLAMDRILGKK
ncbi:MAG: sugar phosphate isomerase/epimerase [Defluviitaleaceae bacterium]|nr:sugar phosphate isomerase/epimerase [Defluviitaleaceae bacterium]